MAGKDAQAQSHAERFHLRQTAGWNGPSQFGNSNKCSTNDEAATHLPLKWHPGRACRSYHPNRASWLLEVRFLITMAYAQARILLSSPGLMHETYSEEGCTILAIYRKPNIFAKSAGFVTGGKVEDRKA